MLTLTLSNHLLAVCRLEPGAPAPAWAAGAFYSVTHTPEEVSVVCLESLVPAGVPCERGWRLLKIEGPLDFGLVGVLAGVLTLLAQAGVSVFTLSTFETDYILVKQAAVQRAVEALRAAGYRIQAEQAAS